MLSSWRVLGLKQLKPKYVGLVMSVVQRYVSCSRREVSELCTSVVRMFEGKKSGARKAIRCMCCRKEIND